MLAEYLRKITNTTSQGDAREESYSRLASFIGSLVGSTERIKLQSQTIEIQKTLTASLLKVEAAVII